MSARQQYIVFALIALVGTVFILSGSLSHNPLVKNLCLSVGTSVLATAIVSWVVRLTLGDPTDALVENIQRTQSELEKLIVRNISVIDRAAQTGLVSLWTSRQELPTDYWIDKLKAANTTIKLLAYAMAFLPDHPEFVNVLEERSKAGCKVYINVGDPVSHHVAEREVEENEVIVPRIHTTMHRLWRLIDSNGFEMRKHDAPLYCSIYMFDDEMIVTPHTFGVRGAAAPALLFRRGPRAIFQKYERHFDEVWKISTDVR